LSQLHFKFPIYSTALFHVGKIFPALVKSGGKFGNTAPLILKLNLKLIGVCIVSFRPRFLSPEEKSLRHRL